jgi:Hsp70 protein/DnaJ C terminal domain
MPASINGCGTTYYGSCDFHTDGSYITTEWIIFIHIPIFPIASYRVLPVDRGQNYLVFQSQNYTTQKVPLCHPQVWNIYRTILMVLLSIIMLWILSWILNYVDSRLSMICFLFSFSVPFFWRTYQSWGQYIFRLARSRKWFDRHSPKRQSSDAKTDLDLILELPLSLEQMCVGVEQQIPVDGGTIDVKVPAGVSPGGRLRIRGKGKFERDSSERGDLYLEIVERTSRVSSSPRERQETGSAEPRNEMPKVCEGTSSVLGIVIGDESLSAGIIQDGYTRILPRRADAAKVADLFAFTENGDEFIHEETVALSFQQLVEDVNNYFNIESSGIIVAVPCWFGIPQHQALKRVAAIANLQLLRCCHTSPLLASIGCKLHSSINQKIVVFEISSRSLSTAILEIGDGVFEVLYTNGEQLNSERFEHLCRVSLMQLLNDAQLTKNQIDEVILLGDSSNAITAQQVILDILDRQPVRNPRSGTEVIIGASICAGILSGVVTDMLLLDVTPWSLGIETQENALGTTAQEGMMTKIIPRNTTFPTKKTLIFPTVTDGQTEVVIHVLQGENLKANDNVSLGTFRLEGILPAPRGVTQIEVTFDIDGNAILQITAKDLRSDKELSVVLN